MLASIKRKLIRLWASPEVLAEGNFVPGPCEGLSRETSRKTIGTGGDYSDPGEGGRDEGDVIQLQAKELQLQGRHQDAKALVDAAIRRAPDNPGLNYRLGMILMALGDPEQAIDHFNLAMHYQNGMFLACSEKIKALEALGRRAEFVAVYAGFLKECPRHLEASIALADLYYRNGDHHSVIQVLEPLVAETEVNHGVANLLGLVLGRELGEFERADTLFRRALASNPDWLPALTNLGWNLLEQGRYEEGYKCIDKALALSPHDVEARLVRACMKLKQGDFAGGWEDYSARHGSRFAIPRPYRMPEWRGQSLEGKTLLMYGEQGIGDQIMFASCFQEVIALSGRSIIDCNPKLVSLFKRSFPEATVHGYDQSPGIPGWMDDAGPIDYQIAMGDLPAILRSGWSDFPHHDGYLRADPESVDRWRRRLAALGPGVSLGLSWRGGSIATRKHMRSMQLAQLMPIIRLRANMVSLQYDSVDEDLRDLRAQTGISLTHWREAIEDYDQTAALIYALDGVLSVCTAVVHLSGALGKTVWVLAPKVTEWRYLNSGDRLPWYPSARVLRQERIGDWDTPIREAAELIASQINDEPLPDGSIRTESA